MVLYAIYQGCYYFLEILRYALLIYCILSWFVSPWNKVMQFFGKIASFFAFLPSSISGDRPSLRIWSRSKSNALSKFGT